jgi:phosphatidylethanolamine-binding protein (PEBP) family uncharacterized protein
MTTDDSKAFSHKQGPHVVPPKGPPEPEITSQQRSEATVASMALSSPALGAPTANSAPALPSAYTCDGKDNWPRLDWQGVPPGTSELVLFAMSVQPVEGKLFFDWAVAGLIPRLTSLNAGQLPAEAVTGRNGFGQLGYSICPAGSGGETYLFALYAIPKALSPSKGFDPGDLRKQVLQASGNAGLLAVSYSRS